jgi:hypothetical protein
LRGITSASLVVAVLLLWPLVASGQKVPRLAEKRTEKPGISSLPNLLATDAGIDKVARCFVARKEAVTWITDRKGPRSLRLHRDEYMHEKFFCVKIDNI